MLRVDVGLTTMGVPVAWARCWPERGGCGSVTCGMGRHLIASSRDMAWTDGFTEGSGSSVPACQDGMCGRVLEMSERAASEFAARPQGAEAKLELDACRRRGTGAEDSWVAICARVLIRVAEFHMVVRSKLIAARRAEVFAGWEAAREAADRVRRTVDGRVLSQAEFAAHEAAQRERERAERATRPDPLAELLAKLDAQEPVSSVRTLAPRSPG